MSKGIAALILFFIGTVFVSCRDETSSQQTYDVGASGSIEEESNYEFARLLDKIENFILTDYLTERDLRTISKDQRKFQLQQIDLNNDGILEIFVFLPTSYFCERRSCPVLLLTNQLELITEFPQIETPIYVQKNLKNGWRILMIQSEGKWREFVFKNGSYSTNPSDVEVNKNYLKESADILFDPKNKELKTHTF